MSWNIPQYIPQCCDAAITAERLEYKASTGSYKAPAYLQSLLEFVAIAVLGGDPFNDLASDELERQLSSVYAERCGYFSPLDNPIKMAMKWAWSPLEGGFIVFDYKELMTAVEALCCLLESEDPKCMLARLAAAYLDDESGNLEYFELGKTMKLLNTPRHALIEAGVLHTAANNQHIIKGYDAV